MAREMTPQERAAAGGFMITTAQKVFATSGALLLLFATGIVGCEPKTRFVRCTQADCVDQTNSLLWSDDVEQRAFERALQRTIERQEAERRWLHSQI